MKHENLVETCKSVIVNRYSFFKDKLHVLPTELIEDVQEAKKKADGPKMYMFNGRWFEEQPEQIKYDWASYQQ
jgi:hypothetical protein